MNTKRLWVLSSTVVFCTIFCLPEETLSSVKRALEVMVIFHLMLEAIRNLRRG